MKKRERKRQRRGGQGQTNFEVAEKDDVHVMRESSPNLPLALFLFLSHSRRASDMGAYELPQCNNSAEKSKENLSSRGGEQSHDDAKSDASASSLVLFLFAASLPLGRRPPPRRGGQERRRPHGEYEGGREREIAKVPAEESQLLPEKSLTSTPTKKKKPSSPRPPLSCTSPPGTPAPPSSWAPSTTSRRSSRE